MRYLKFPKYHNSYIYLLILFLGIPFTMLYNMTAGVMRAIGDSRTPFIFLAFSTVSNIFLDIFCITVLHWGVAGAAIATVAAQGMSGFLCLFYMIKKYPVLIVFEDGKISEVYNESDIKKFKLGDIK